MLGQPAHADGQRIRRELDVGIQHEVIVGAAAMQHQVVRGAVADVRVTVQERQLHVRVLEAALRELDRFLRDRAVAGVVDQRERYRAHRAVLARRADREHELAQAPLEQPEVRAGT